MTTTAPPNSIPTHQPHLGEPATRPAIARTHPPGPTEKAIPPPPRRGPTTLFQVPFASAMSDPDVALLARQLDLTTHMHPKLRRSPAGTVRLDYYSGLFLERGAAEGEWLLEARTWGDPTPEKVHAWHVLAAGAARLLDPAVISPDRVTAVFVQYPMRPLGRAANKRLARTRRRILGLR
jgi:hypothetical protein